MAGSERPTKIGTEVTAYNESLHINSSLQNLGNVIELASKPDVSLEAIPYESNLLTALMKDSIGGNSYTFMIVNVSPSEYDKKETIDSLRFAKTTGQIVNRVE